MARTTSIAGSARPESSTIAEIGLVECDTEEGFPIWALASTTRTQRGKGDIGTVHIIWPGPAPQTSPREQAMGIITDDPWNVPSCEALADRIGCHPDTLRKDKKFMAIYRKVRVVGDAPARGRRDDGIATPESEDDCDRD